MPLSTSPSSPKMSTAPVATHTQTSTKAKVAAVGVGLLATGLAAYGFGFLPGIDFDKEKLAANNNNVIVTEQQQDQNQVPELSIADRCRQACVQRLNECLSVYDADKDKCAIESTQCQDQCGVDFPIAMDTEQPAKPTPPPSLPEILGPSSTPPIPSSCTMTAQAMPDFRQPATLVPGEAWHPLAQYELTAGSSAVDIHRFNLKTSHDYGSFAYVAVAYRGTILGQGVIASRPMPYADIPLVSTLTIPAGSSIQIQLWARLNPIVARSTTAPGLTSGVPRSGNLVNLGLASGIYGGEWNERYAGKYHIEATCGTVGMSVYASAAPAQGGRDFTVRRSTLEVTQQPLRSTMLGNGTQDVYSFQVSSGPAADTSFKRVTWRYTRPSGPSSLSIGNFRLFRNGNEMPRRDYRIVDENWVDLNNQMLSPSSTMGTISLIFNNEELVSSRNIYTLQATVRNAALGDTFVLDPRLDGPDPSITGYLTADRVGGLNLDTSEPADDISEHGAWFLWSDLSEVPHIDTPGIRGGSRDWIANSLEYTLRPQTLSR